MKASIITIGDEILIGQIVDTNSSYIAKQLDKIGISVAEMRSISDDKTQILETLSELQNQFDVKHDFQNHIKQLQNVQFELASGLANWVPKITHQSGIYVVNATAGSGKTQLAKELLKKQTHHKKAYICFNRPLADHMQKIVGINSSVQTFHEYCLEFVKSRCHFALAGSQLARACEGH